jgi:HK97 family phage prohead protease
VCALLKAGALKGLSFGFDVIHQVYINGVRYLQAVKLYEVSVTAFPAQPLATVSAVKK